MTTERGHIMKKSLIFLILLLTMFISVTAYAGSGICHYNGCGADMKYYNNGTVFCDRHAAMYAKEQGYKVCGMPGCYDKAKSNGYCSGHTCRNYSCNNKTWARGGYCSVHYKSSSSSRTAYKKTYSYSSKKSTSSYKRSTSYKKSSSSAKRHYYCDPDDYDDPDEYADDAWGMDFDSYDEAYDYWENW